MFTENESLILRSLQVSGCSDFPWLAPRESGEPPQVTSVPSQVIFNFFPGLSTMSDLELSAFLARIVRHSLMTAGKQRRAM